MLLPIFIILAIVALGYLALRYVVFAPQPATVTSAPFVATEPATGTLVASPPPAPVGLQADSRQLDTSDMQTIEEVMLAIAHGQTQKVADCKCVYTCVFADPETLIVVFEVTHHNWGHISHHPTQEYLVWKHYVIGNPKGCATTSTHLVKKHSPLRKVVVSDGRVTLQFASSPEESVEVSALTGKHPETVKLPEPPPQKYNAPDVLVIDDEKENHNRWWDAHKEFQSLQLEGRIQVTSAFTIEDVHRILAERPPKQWDAVLFDGYLRHGRTTFALVPLVKAHCPTALLIANSNHSHEGEANDKLKQAGCNLQLCGKNDIHGLMRELAKRDPDKFVIPPAPWDVRKLIRVEPGC